MTTRRPGAGARRDGDAPGAQRPGGELDDLLPARTRDEQDTSWDWREGVRDDDERYLRERPPHHEG